jgi:hypothetical protein
MEKKIPFMLLLLVGGIQPLASQTNPEADYIKRWDARLDSTIAELEKLPQKPVLFAANLIWAHGAGIKSTNPESLLLYVDSLKAVGAQRVDFSPGLTSLDIPEVAEKYDALVRRIREGGLQLGINLEYCRIAKAQGETRAVKDIEDFKTLGVKACAAYAARYHPEVLVPVHEPYTMDQRMYTKSTTDQWRDYVEAAVKAVKKVSPKTRVGGGGNPTRIFGNQPLTFEVEFLRKCLTIPDLDFITMDVYDLGLIPLYDALTKEAHAVKKGIYIEETHRPSYVGGPIPADFISEEGEAHTAKGAGNAIFEELDAKWIKAMALYSSTRGMEAVTPFWSQTFFLYVTSGPDQGIDPAYNAKVRQAMVEGKRTASFRAYQEWRRKLGVKTTPPAKKD